MSNGNAFNTEEKTKANESNGSTLVVDEHEGASLQPPAFGNAVQMKPHEDHKDHDHHHHTGDEHEHTNEDTGAPTADNENGRNGIYTPAEKDDQIDKEIEDNDVGFMEQLRKMIFMAQNYGPQMMTSSTGTGGFSASFNPRTQQLNVSTLAMADFHSPLIMDPAGSGLVFVNPTGSTSKDNTMQGVANAANSSLNVADRASLVATYTWTAQEITDGMTSLNEQLDVAEDIWGGQHSFFVDKDGWRDVRAQVNVNITATQGVATDGTDHFSVRSVKTPPGGPDLGAFVRSFGDVETRSNFMFLDDDTLTGVNDNNFLHQIVLFEQGKADLSSDATDLLDMLIIRNRDDATQVQADADPTNDSVDNEVLNKFRLVGHCSSEGSDSVNQKLAAERIKAVSAYLTAGGLDQAAARIETENKGEEEATEDADWRRVDIYIGSGEAQHTIAHEMGHVFGLKDEYAINPGGGLGGSGQPTGSVVDHDPLSTQIGAPNATSENTDGIMAMGNTVRGQHYSTFGEALRVLTNLSEWRLIQ